MNTTMAGRLCAADLGSGCGWTSVGLGLCEVNAPRLFVCTDLVLTFLLISAEGTIVNVSVYFCFEGVQRISLLFKCSIIW